MSPRGVFGVPKARMVEKYKSFFSQAVNEKKRDGHMFLSLLVMEFEAVVSPAQKKYVYVACEFTLGDSNLVESSSMMSSDCSSS